MAALACVLLGSSCPPLPAPTPVLTVKPVCAMQVTSFMDNPKADSPLISLRAATNVEHGFERLRAVAGPMGNSAVGFKPDVYGFTEAWLRNAGAPGVFRAQSHPARRPQANDFEGSAWTVRFQDNRAGWSGIAVRSANPGEEVDSPEAGGLATPQLMPVGLATAQMFACGGVRSEDDRVRTTSLFELIPPSASSPGNAQFIQDLLNGDDRFVPNRPGPIVGPANPPTPTIHNLPGNPTRDGAVLCAMTQFEDDLSTRELHMLTISNGTLYHAMASNWSDATTESGSTFKRFNSVSSWADVAVPLGRNFGTVVSAALVARPRSINVLFLAKSANRHKLWHTVRFSANGGSWRTPDDVLALNLANGNGVPDEYRLALGECPLYGPEAVNPVGPNDTELVYVMYRPADPTMLLGRIVSTPIEWVPGVLTGVYSPLQNVTSLMTTTSDTTRNHRIDRVVISTRPFADNATP
jgi:hypothetical protein